MFSAAQCGICRFSQLMKLLGAKLLVACVDTHVCVSSDWLRVCKTWSLIYQTKIAVFIGKKCVTLVTLTH